MAQVGDIGTLKELGVMPGDVVEFFRAGHIFFNEYNERLKGYRYTVNEYKGADCGDSNFLHECCHRFRLISRAADTPTLWRDMTPEQRAAIPQSVFDDPTNPLQIPWGEWSRVAKGAVLLARHEGKVIDLQNCHGVWVDVTPAWGDDTAYRVRPEPPRVALMADGVKVGTVAMIDGKVDRDSVEWA